MRLNPKEARLFKDRWKAVEEFHIKELRRMKPSEKLAELDLLYRTAQVFGWSLSPSPGQEKEIRRVRRRWAKIKRGMKIG